jgi:hypothetical protein
MLSLNINQFFIYLMEFFFFCSNPFDLKNEGSFLPLLELFD